MVKDFRSTKRRWIKLYPTESLQGSIRYQLSSAERGVWFDLLSFSSLCSNTGDICDRDGNPFPDTYIANRFNVKLSLLKSTIDKCLAEGRLTRDETGYHITNWSKYQSEYDRQKPYRQKKRHHLEAAQALKDNPELGYGEDLGYTYEMFCEDYDALDNHQKAGGLGDDLATSQYFWDKYGWSKTDKTDMKGTRLCRLFMSAFNAIKANDESNPDNPDDEQVVKETLASLQS